MLPRLCWLKDERSLIWTVTDATGSECWNHSRGIDKEVVHMPFLDEVMQLPWNTSFNWRYG